MHTKLLVITGIVISQSTWANLTPKSYIGLAGIDFQGKVVMDYGYNDNVFYQPHSNDAIGSSFQNVAPVLSIIGERSRDKYLLMYSGDYRNYSGDSADNCNDHFFRFNGVWQYGLKHGLILNLEDSLGYESRGCDITEGFLPSQFEQYGTGSPLITNLISSELRYSYGAPDGRGKAELALLYKKLTSGNTSDVRDSSEDPYSYIQGQEWHENSLIAEVFDQYSSRTRLCYNFITNQRRYDGNSEKDTNEYYLLHGLKSQLMGKTNVDMNISWLYKTFESNANSHNFSGLSWDIKVEWKSSQQSVFTAYSAQSIKDPPEVGGYTLMTQYGLSYQHFWLDARFPTLLDYSFTSEDYKKQNKDRYDKGGVFSATMNYGYTPSANFGVKYQIDTLSSNKDTDSFYIGPNDNQEAIRTLGHDNSMIMLKAKVQI